MLDSGCNGGPMDGTLHRLRTVGVVLPVAVGLRRNVVV